jgi:hypothetical protein
VPWFDAVNHARFSLHGVGYSSRYQGGLPRDKHGIQSDDYVSAEILTGHALMVERSCGVRGAVRKYWLAQDFIESIALDDIASAGSADGDIHRLHVTWKSGAEVWVNRGTNDWTVSQRVLPPLGYLARNGGVESSIDRVAGRIVERSQSARGSYFNPRPAADAGAVDFGIVKTTGAFRLEGIAGADGLRGSASQSTSNTSAAPALLRERDRVRSGLGKTDVGPGDSEATLGAANRRMLVFPLPDSPAFEVSLKLDRLLPRSLINRPSPPSSIKVHIIDAAGARGEEIPVTTASWQISFTTRKGDFGYRIDY